MKKSETLAEYLARGGVVQIVPPASANETKTTVNSTSYNPQVMDLEEGGLYFAEPSKLRAKSMPKTKVKSSKEVDVAKLPEHLRKYL